MATNNSVGVGLSGATGTVNFVGSTSPTIVSPVVSTGLTASGSATNDFSGSTGAFKSSSGANQISGAATITDATTPSLTTSAGKTNTGFVQVNGKTSGALKITTADATAQTLTLTVAAQTVGAATLTIPNLAGVNTVLALSGTTFQTVKSQVFTVSGTYTPSTGMLYCIVRGWAAGGGGGSVFTGGGGGAGGGATGAYAEIVLTAAQIGSSQTVTIGALGAGGASGGTNTGGTGGDTSLGTLLIAKGGLGGVGAAGGAGATTAAGGLGVASTAGDVKGTGGSGGSGFSLGVSQSISGAGANSSLGFGGLFVITVASGNLPGNAASGFASGGGGAASSNSTSSAGGSGAPGILYIIEYCNQ
jgi:hypothetical protein